MASLGSSSSSGEPNDGLSSSTFTQLTLSFLALLNPDDERLGVSDGDVAAVGGEKLLFLVASVSDPTTFTGCSSYCCSPFDFLGVIILARLVRKLDDRGVEKLFDLGISLVMLPLRLRPPPPVDDDDDALALVLLFALSNLLFALSDAISSSS